MTPPLTADAPAPRPRPAAEPAGARTEVVLHRRSGLIRASGHLTRQGADLVRGTADGLRGEGHRTVVLDLERVLGADEAALAVLQELADDLAAAGVRLVVRGAPVTPRAGRT